MSAIITHKEAEEARMAKIIGCWYCDRKRCCLTHKADPLKDAKHPERDPYADERPYWGLPRGMMASEVLRLAEKSK